MLQLSAMIIKRPILSLRTSSVIGETAGAIINPDNLKIEGFYCQLFGNRSELVLLSQDIRDVLPQGVVVNDQEVLTDPSELVRLNNLIAIRFDPLGKQVVTTNKAKIGKVSDFSVDIESMYIKKLYVTQSLLRNFNGGNLGVDRTQIVEITDKKIVINDLEQKAPARAGAMA